MKKKSSHNFSKFATKKSNAAIKEQYKQEKRKLKKEREEYFEKKKAETRAKYSGEVNQQPRQKGQAAAPAVHSKPQVTETMPLNKFIAHAGVAARREAAELVKKGLVKVNNELVKEPGHKVSATDDIRVNGKKIFLAKNLVYILLNKPKDFITTTDDPQGRKTVLDIIGRATQERVYPVGRLDRNTSGVLLLTNDGELAQKLTHPSNEVKKVYHVTLNRPLDKKDFEQILKGVVLEDGPANVDVLAYADMKDKTQVGVEIHSGRNRIVRRIFEHLGYDVKGLDRVVFAGLTKKNIDRGKWRFLTEKEVRDLKHFRKGK
jgi:23S rRNA pseudouridine2605 synthase